MTWDIARSVLPILAETRPMLLPLWGKAKELTRKTNAASSAVTALDQSIEKFLNAKLCQLDPTISFVWEEFGGARTAERYWLCDPIDGTDEFIRGLMGSSVMVALIEQQQVVFGAVYDFINDVVYYAQKGHGAFADGKSIRVSTRPAKDAYIVFETHLDKPINRETFFRIQALTGVHSSETAGMQFARLAAGRIDAYISVDPYGKDYDFAPGSLLVAEAGGIVANVGRRSYDFRDGNFIAATPAVYRTLTEGRDAIFAI